MSGAADIFHALCAAPDLAAAIAELKPHDLTRLLLWLGDQEADADSVPGLVLDLAKTRAAHHFVKAHS